MASRSIAVVVSCGGSTKTYSPGTNVASNQTFFSWAPLYRPYACRRLGSAIRFSSAAQRIRQVRSANAESTCSTSGSIGLAVRVAGPSDCRLAIRLNGGSFVARCTYVLSA